MSRIGRLPVAIPAGVTVDIQENNHVVVKGPKGTLERELHKNINVTIDNNIITVTRPNDNKENRSLHGLTRTLISNMIEGVVNEYKRELEINGVGYRAQKKGNKLVMNLGYSHPVEMVDPEGIETEVPDATTVIVKGSDKAKVGNYAANIRAWRKPEPYKGKGIIMEGEVVQKKEGKSGAK